MKSLVVSSIMAAWIMWLGDISNLPDVSWRPVKEFREGDSTVWTPEAFCKSLEEALFGKGLFLCLPEGALPPGPISEPQPSSGPGRVM